MGGTLYTIGHSTHPIERFIELLKLHSITAICDVRSTPYSRMNPQFNRESLRDTLKQSGISYVFLGDELGARSKDPACYRNGKVSYALVAKTPTFRDGLERVKKGAENYKVALMCAEKDPLQCHRTILVARNLAREDVAVWHILADGGLETQEQAEERLLDQGKVTNADLFLSYDELLDQAYERQARAIAYEEERVGEAEENKAAMI